MVGVPLTCVTMSKQVLTTFLHLFHMFIYVLLYYQAGHYFIVNIMWHELLMISWTLYQGKWKITELHVIANRKKKNLTKYLVTLSEGSSPNWDGVDTGELWA